MIALSVLTVFLLASSYVFNWGYFFANTLLAKGSYARYAMMTLVWGAMLPANANVVLVLVSPNETYPIWVKLIVAIGTFFTDWMVWHSDDDNYWRNKRKRVTRWLRNRVTVTRLNPVSVNS